jgi:hypothetical protein
VILWHSLLDILLAEIKGDIPNTGYMANVTQERNRFIVKGYFDKLKELLMRLGIMGKPKQISNIEKMLLVKFLLLITNIYHVILN